MSKQTFIRVATCVFTIAGVVHLYRAINDLPLLFGTYVLPVEASWVAGIALIFLAYAGYRHWK